MREIKVGRRTRDNGNTQWWAEYDGVRVYHTDNDHNGDPMRHLHNKLCAATRVGYYVPNVLDAIEAAAQR